MESRETERVGCIGAFATGTREFLGGGERSQMHCAIVRGGGVGEMLSHRPVMPDEVLELLAPKAGGAYLDATFGGGGHTRAILEAEPEASVVAADWDPDAGERAKAFADAWGGRFEFLDLGLQDLGNLGEARFDGALLDLGLSSYQIETPSRGFSYSRHGPLDMRMNPRNGVPASVFLETASKSDLVRAVRDFGEEPSWRRVVAAILRARGSGRLADTTGLAGVVSAAVLPNRNRRARIHPATRTFQGIRIAVNNELRGIEAGLAAAFALLVPGGVLATLGFHSLEDRIVKRAFRRWAGMPESRFDARPQQERTRCAQMLTNRPLRPSERETDQTPRSRSARLRAIRKLGGQA